MTSTVFSTDWRKESPNKDPKHKALIVKARREIDLADHLVYVTMPLTADMKFVLAISEHLYSASYAAIEAMLEQRRYYKKLEAFPRTFSAMVDIWVRYVQDEAEFDQKYATFLKRIQEIKHAIATSSLRFRRQDKYILTSDVYDLKVLDLETVKKYLSLAKDFLDKSEAVVRQEDERQSVLRENE
jgi:hypothetical protein